VGIRGVNLGSLERVTPGEDGREMLSGISDKEEDQPNRLLERSELQGLLAEAIQKIPDNERLFVVMYYTMT
jgi:DNA-directed RNA polymerase specialized sigma subunit